MSVLESKTIDIISTDKQGRVVLTVTDHLSWEDENHLHILQKKLNAYLAFVESGEVYEKYADAKGRAFLFKVSCKFRPNAEGLDFLTKAKEIIERAGFQFQHDVSAPSYDN
jgi:hypothetical protein